MLKIWRLEKNVHIIAKTYHNFLIREIRTHPNECRLQFIDGQLSISRGIKRVELFRPHFSGFINFRHFFLGREEESGLWTEIDAIPFTCCERSDDLGG